MTRHSYEIESQGKKVCEVLLNGAWYYIAVSTLRFYPRRDKLSYRCHYCQKSIRLFKGSHDGEKAAHFEHVMFNPKCHLRYRPKEKERRIKEAAKVIANSEAIKESFNHNSLIPETLSLAEQTDIHGDIEDLFNDASASTEREALISARCGQGQFRRAILDMWGGCSITGSENTCMLRASHIKPWRDSNNKERLDPYNGLLLVPNLDAAFDQHLISFDATGKIIISRRFEDYALFGIKRSMKLKVEDKHQMYLKHHRASLKTKDYA